MKPEDIHRALAEMIGQEAVSTAPSVLAEHSADKWFASHPPDVVVFARSTAEVSAVLAFASRHGIPVTPRGGGAGYVGGCVPVHGGIALSLMRMNRIREINVADGVAVVEPGVITGDLQREVRKAGWFYPPDPASLKECSIGGNVAANAGGPRCLKYGVTRHYVLGLEVVLADGAILRTGGRCHKNRTGFDLVGLFVGSEGMLGVVTEITLRIIPHPPARRMLSAGFSDFASAAAAVQAILAAGHLPSAMEITDAFTLDAVRSHLGTANVPEGAAHLLLEIDGRSGALADELRELEEIVRRHRPAALQCAETEAQCEAFWEMRREFSYSLRATGLTKLNEDIVVPRSRLVDLVNFAAGLREESGLPIACFGHAGDGNIHVNIMVPDMNDPAQRSRAEAALDRLFAQVLGWGGVISGEHGIGLAKKRWFSQAASPVARSLHARLKHALDPGEILNPGKFIDQRGK